VHVSCINSHTHTHTHTHTRAHTRTGHVQTMATNEWGFTVLCMALTVVDDTSLVSKVIVAELKVGALCVYCVRVSAFMCKYRKKLP